MEVEAALEEAFELAEAAADETADFTEESAEEAFEATELAAEEAWEAADEAFDELESAAETEAMVAARIIANWNFIFRICLDIPQWWNRPPFIPSPHMVYLWWLVLGLLIASACPKEEAHAIHNSKRKNY